MQKKYIIQFSILTISLFLSSCLSVPESVSPVKEFEVDNYLGKWYEIARLDHSFERGLTQVTAKYSLREDGGIDVLNRGFSMEKNEWKDAKGKAYFVADKDTGHLKVSFFGPFYGSYIIFGLDKEEYQYAFVCGPNTSYLWLLSRSPVVEDQIIEEFTKKSKKLGFETEDLILVEQTVNL